MSDQWLPLLRGYKRPARHPVRVGDTELRIGKRFLQRFAKNPEWPVPVLVEFDLLHPVGWVTALRVTDDLTLEARVELSEAAAPLLARTEYRYLAPEWYDDPPVLTGVALTNTPAARDHPPIVQETDV